VSSFFAHETKATLPNVIEKDSQYILIERYEQCHKIYLRLHNSKTCVFTPGTRNVDSIPDFTVAVELHRREDLSDAPITKGDGQREMYWIEVPAQNAPLYLVFKCTSHDAWQYNDGHATIPESAATIFPIPHTTVDALVFRDYIQARKKVSPPPTRRPSSSVVKKDYESAGKRAQTSHDVGTWDLQRAAFRSVFPEYANDFDEMEKKALCRLHRTKTDARFVSAWSTITMASKQELTLTSVGRFLRRVKLLQIHRQV
jgi:hypothetical protein